MKPSSFYFMVCQPQFSWFFFYFVEIMNKLKKNHLSSGQTVYRFATQKVITSQI